MKKIILIVIFLLLSAPKSVGHAAVQADAVKAAFIYHFINFTEWRDDWANYYVCIPEDEALREAAHQLLDGKTVNSRDIVVVNRSRGCHILIAEKSPSSSTMLTIGSLARGAMMEFRTVDNKLKFAVHMARLKRSKLKISSQLLKLAIVEEGF